MDEKLRTLILKVYGEEVLRMLNDMSNYRDVAEYLKIRAEEVQFESFDMLFAPNKDKVVYGSDAYIAKTRFYIYHKYICGVLEYEYSEILI